nr:MAG TPA: hypothetical protein [Caudoviricetes sp.]
MIKTIPPERMQRTQKNAKKTNKTNLYKVINYIFAYYGKG